MLWTCAACSCAYAVGAPCCPHCGSVDRSDPDMPKIHKDRPPTDAADLATPADVEPAEQPAEPVAEPEQPADEKPTRTRKATK